MTRTDDTETNLTLALIQTPILTLTRVTMADRDDTETIAISDMTYAMVMETGTPAPSQLGLGSSLAVP